MNRLVRFVDQIGITQYTPFKFAADLFFWTLAAPLAFILRMETDAFSIINDIILYTGVSVGVKALAIYFGYLHRQSWHKISVKDLYRILRAVGWATIALLAGAFILFPIVSIPRSIPILDGGLGLLALSTMRLIVRLLHEREQRSKRIGPVKNVVVAGAGEAGTMIVREMLRHPEAGYQPIGYVDDDSGKRNDLFLGLPVMGNIDDIAELHSLHTIDEILIAMPSSPGDVIRRIVEEARKAKIKYRIIPGMYDILSGKVSINQIREVDVEDLLRRDPIKLDTKAIANYIAGRRVVVTGAGGSIGSEIVRQVIRFNPAQLILVERDENNLYLFEQEIKRDHPHVIYESIVMDIQNRDKVKRVFAEHQPDVVFHAAAHKHVPVMELNPDEAILNNVLGTKNLLDAAREAGTERFVNISTDKAVRPTSVMGASKRIAEYLVQQVARQVTPEQAFVSVRFGNVLGSRGSVVPIFKEQINQGGPVTITHEDMTRYFMSIPEATQLVLQAAALGDNGALYILDMGEPVRIMDLARDLIELSGLRVDIDIPIQVVGMRPGEKLYEELLTSEEDVISTEHDKIQVIRKRDNPVMSDLDTIIESLANAARKGENQAIVTMLSDAIPGATLTD